MKPAVEAVRSAGRHAARWLAALGLLASLGAQAQTSEDTAILDGLVRSAGEYLALKEPQAHPLRSQLHDLVQTQLAALRPVYAQWLRQSQTESPTLSASAHYKRLALRQVNAHGWMMAAESGLALADASVRAQARWCESLPRNASWYELRVRLLEALPPDQWPAALTLERQALALLAQPPAAAANATPASADTPVGLDAVAPALQALRQEQRAGTPPLWPLPPGLVAPVLGALDAPVLFAPQRCRLAQWWWLHPAAAGTPTPGRLMALALQGDGSEQLGLAGRPQPDADPDDAYPAAARRLELEGVVRVQWAVPAAGQGPQVQVVSRQLRVARWPDAVAPGLVGLLDEASRQQGLQVANSPPRAGNPPPKTGVVEQEFMWKLE